MAAFFKVDVLVAVVLVELDSLLWWSDISPLGRNVRLSRRQLLCAFVSDIFLGVALKFVIRNFWPLRSWLDAVHLTLWVIAVYAFLEAPQRFKGSHPISKLTVNVLHRLSVVLIMLLTLFVFLDS